MFPPEEPPVTTNLIDDDTHPLCCLFDVKSPKSVEFPVDAMVTYSSRLDELLLYRCKDVTALVEEDPAQL
jgi:hypothetical protein